MKKALAFVLLALAMSGATAQEIYPNRPIRLVVPFPPGNAGDIIARVIAPAMGELLKQNLVVDDRPGAGGVIASEVTRKAAADGYTLMLVTAGSHGIVRVLVNGTPIRRDEQQLELGELPGTRPELA